MFSPFTTQAWKGLLPHPGEKRGVLIASKIDPLLIYGSIPEALVNLSLNLSADVSIMHAYLHFDSCTKCSF